MDHYRENAKESRAVLVTAFNGYVFGVSVESGEIVWEHALDGHDEVEVLIRPGRLYACNGRELVCLETSTGGVLHRQTALSRFGVSDQPPTMVIEGERLFLGSKASVSCFTLECESLWSQPFPGKGSRGAVALGFLGNFRQADLHGEG